MTESALIDRMVVERNIWDGHTSVDHRRLMGVVFWHFNCSRDAWCLFQCEHVFIDMFVGWYCNILRKRPVCYLDLIALFMLLPSLCRM